MRCPVSNPGKLWHGLRAGKLLKGPPVISSGLDFRVLGFLHPPVSYLHGLCQAHERDGHDCLEDMGLGLPLNRGPTGRVKVLQAVYQPWRPHRSKNVPTTKKLDFGAQIPEPDCARIALDFSSDEADVSFSSVRLLLRVVYRVSPGSEAQNSVVDVLLAANIHQHTDPRAVRTESRAIYGLGLQGASFARSSDHFSPEGD